MSETTNPLLDEATRGMPQDIELGQLAALFAKYHAGVLSQLADAPASAMKQELEATVGRLHSHVDTMLAAFKQEEERILAEQAEALAHLKAAKEAVAAIEKDYQEAMAKQAALAVVPAKFVLDPGLHARLRD